ncbi:phage tail tape measure protein [Actinacidiphila reveromycinica]|uniref:phage tail tape measure protein n=1 Tax=Actinacidiphila reveromycinica TaxID=659352 RepID=UPI001920C66E|nr:phage tail tape measure protein [Streptomyces sp. SN-593]
MRFDVIARDSASKAFDKIGKQAGKLDGGFGKVIKSAAKFGAVLSGSVAAGLAVAADKAVDFQTEMTRIQTQAGASAKDVSTLSKQVLSLGKSTQQGPQQLSEALYHLKSVGMDNVDAMKALKTASDLAAVGGSDLEATTNALAGAWRTGIKGATNMDQAARTLNATIGAGNMSMEDMVSALGTGILPTAKTFGLTLSQVGSALALFTDEGVDSASAATRLRMSISLLAAPSGAASKQLKKIGLTGTQLGDAMRGKDGIIGAISLLKDHLDKSGLSATQSAALLSRAFGGGKSSSAILSMVNNLDVLEKKQVQVNNSMDKFPAAVTAQRKTVQAQFNLIKSNLQVMEIELGDKVLPILSSVVQYITKTGIPTLGRFTAAAANLIPIEALKSRASQLGGILQSAYKSVGLDKLTDLLGGSTKKATYPVYHRVTADSSSPIQPGTTAAQSKKLNSTLNPTKVFKGGENLSASQSKALASAGKANPGGLGNFGENLSPAQSQALSKAAAPPSMTKRITSVLAAAIGNAIKTVDWHALGGTLGNGLDAAFGFVADHSKALGKDVSKAIQNIDWVDVGKTFGTTAIPLAIGFIDKLFAPLFTVSFWKKHWLDAIIAVLSVVPIGKVGDAIGTVFSKIPWGDSIKAIGAALDKIPWVQTLDWASWIGRTSGRAATAVGDVVTRMYSAFTGAFTRVAPRLAGWLGTELGLIPTRIGLMGLELQSAAEKAFKTLTDSVPGISGKFVRVVLRYLGKFTFYQSGIDLISGLYNGVVARLEGAAKWVRAHIVDPFVSYVKSAFGIHSPSTVFAGIGGYLISGLYSGITSALAGVGKWVVSHIKSPLVSAVVKPSSWLTGAGGSLIHGLMSGASAVMNDAKSGIGHWAGQVKDKIVGSIKAVFGIHSPSKVMAELGGHMMSGLMKGLLQGKDVLNAAVKGLFHSPLDAAESLLSNGVSLPAKWAAKLLSAKTPNAGSGTPLSPGVASAQKYASGLVGQMWPKSASSEMSALIKLWNSESGWRANAENPTSGAYGIPQSLPGSKMAAAGSDWRTNAATQIRWGLSYIKGRYGDPMTAWASWNSHSPHWYAKGTPGSGAARGWAWVGEKGPELVNFGGGETVLSHLDSLLTARSAGIKIPGYASGTVSLSRARSDVSKAQKQVDALEKQIAALRRAEATAHTKAQRKADQLAIMAAEEDLKAARKRLTAANKELATANSHSKQVQSVANTLANGWLKTLQTGTASAIASAVKSMNTKLQAAGAGGLVSGMNKSASKLESLANQRAAIQSKIASAKSYASDQASSLGDYLGIGDTSASSVSSLITQMQQSQSTAKSFATEVAKLSKMGLSKTLLSQLADAGPGSQLASTLAGASSSDIANLNKLAAAQNKLTTSYGNSLADSMYDSGSQAGKGFLTGLQAQEKAIQAEMNKLAAGMVSTIKKKLGIHSPSRVMRDQVGKQVALGAAAGVRMHAPQAVRATQRMADMMGAVRVQRSGSGSMATAAAPARGGEFTGKLYLDSGQFLGVVQGTVEPLIRNAVEAGIDDLAAAAGNTGGA